MKQLAIILILVLVLTKSHGQIDTARRFLQATDFVKSNTHEIGKLWLATIKNKSSNIDFKKIIKDTFSFNVTDTISFYGVYPFRDSLLLNKEYLGLTADEISNPSVFDSRYYFEPVINSILGSLKKQQPPYNSSFRLSFSEPTKYFLAGELWPTLYGDKFRSRYGEGMLLLFIFDEAGSLKKTYYKPIFK